MATFTPPTAAVVPPFLPDTTGPAKNLFKYFKARKRGVNVFKLSNGTYVQDYPTPENSNTAIPYPIIPDGQPYATSWLYSVPTYFNQAVTVVTTYYGGHSYTVSAAEATALTAAGYGDSIT